VERIEANPTLTLPEILDASNHDDFPNISFATLHRYLDHQVISYKQITVRSQQGNAPETIEARAQWSRYFLEHQEITYGYIHEFGFDLAMQRHYGRARRGRPANPIHDLYFVNW
jgi:hypothetical protein